MVQHSCHLRCDDSDVSFAEWHLGMADDGDVFMMGLNDVGQLGMKKPEVLNIPTRVSSLDLHRVTHLATGFSHVLATTEQVTYIYQW